MAESKTSPAPAQAVDKDPRTRSPNFPVVGLETALDYTRKVYDKAAHHTVPLMKVVTQYWSMKEKSSYAQQLIGALRGFGLLDVEGVGDKRQAKVSPAAQKILTKHADSQKLLRAAALAPSIHRVVWEKYGRDGLPPDESMEHFLLHDHDPPFNMKTIPQVIAEIRATFQFAKIEPDVTIDKPPQETPQDTREKVNVGDYILWTSQGVEQFSEPVEVVRKVQGYVFIDGSDTGIPVDEVTIAHASPPPKDDGAAALGDVRRSPKVGFASLSRFREEKYAAEAGEVTFRFPAKITAAEADDIELWLDMLKRKVKRSVAESSPG